jgi:curved DNA-binding protein CbpA
MSSNTQSIDNDINEYDLKLEQLRRESLSINSGKSTTKVRRRRRRRRRIIDNAELNKEIDELELAKPNSVDNVEEDIVLDLDDDVDIDLNLEVNDVDNDEESTEDDTVNRKVDDKPKQDKDISLNYYAILGVSDEASHIDIIRATKKKALKYNPSNAPSGTSSDELKKMKIAYSLIVKASEILSDPRKRSAYDYDRKRIKTQSRDFISQKEEFEKFKELQSKRMTDEDRELAKLNFDQQEHAFNTKHGFDPDGDDAKPMTEDEINMRMSDALLRREQEETDFEHENLFEGRDFDPAEFNKMFLQRSRNTRKKGGELATIGDVDAFNYGDNDFGMGASIDSDNLYATGEFNGFASNFTGVNTGFIDTNIDIGSSEDDLEEYNSYNTHNQGTSKESLDKLLNKALQEREDDDAIIKNFSIEERGTVMDDKYGISSKLGFIVGDSMFNDQEDSTIHMDDEDYEIYKQLTE